MFLIFILNYLVSMILWYPVSIRSGHGLTHSFAYVGIIRLTLFYTGLSRKFVGISQIILFEPNKLYSDIDNESQNK